MTEYFDLVGRLLAAVLIGCVIGADRNLHGKPTGIKTLGMVGLGASMLTVVSMEVTILHPTLVSLLGSAMQGIITGIGFLGAGVIIHEASSEKVHGLTTAASIWVTAALGIVCGLGSWKIAMTSTALVFILFIFGRPLEKKLHRHWLEKSEMERKALSTHED
jgi:putative Mg2+ transporter-C (MgtC) family protein